MQTICSVLKDAAAELPEKPLFIFPETRWCGEEVLTYSGLVQKSAQASRAISACADRGERALLLFPAGAAFWEAFMGCLACGVVAVPLNIPNINRPSAPLQEVCKDCSPSVLLTDDKTAELLTRRADKHPWFSQLAVITPDHWRAETGQSAFDSLTLNRPAFLQYTSGSTASPRGVQISHANLLANLEMIRDSMRIRVNEDTGVTWLPHYHDMGLVGGYLETLFTKNTTLCLPPEDFALRPARWLELISESRASVCGGPGFAYRMCVEKISQDQLAGLDLSSWRVAYVGAERIRPETLLRFNEKFQPAGFQESSFFPCYGLGEATLLVTGGPAGEPPQIRRVSAAALMHHRIAAPGSADDGISLCSSGQTVSGTDVVILNTVDSTILPDEMIGEIFLSGPSLTDGYFNRHDLNQELFRELTIAGRTQRYLQTGDLGFLANGQLFITGRTKEIIIVRGRNLYPEDIEQQVSAAHPALTSAGVVAFSVDSDGEESLVVAVEMPRAATDMESPENVIAAIRQCIAAGSGVNPKAILLLPPFSIPRTSSGKPRRLMIRASYLQGSLNCVAKEEN
ncbi:MAG: fatty acyl-AMP ligase [Planctomycetaceae bacterium]|nr:fatty acyl-AMP ligase [Planctomycetaceae bacterium]